MNKRTRKRGSNPILSFRIDPRIRAALEREAGEQDRTLSWLINTYIKNGLGLDPFTQPQQEQQQPAQEAAA